MRTGTHPGLRPPRRGGEQHTSPLGRGAALAAGWVLSGPTVPASGRSLSRRPGVRPSWPLAGWKPALLAPVADRHGAGERGAAE